MLLILCCVALFLHFVDVLCLLESEFTADIPNSIYIDKRCLKAAELVRLLDLFEDAYALSFQVQAEEIC